MLKLKAITGALLLSAAFLLLTAGVSQAVTYNLTAGSVTKTMPDGTPVLMWGFGLDNGPVTVPGPELHVPSGGSLTIHLTNNLTVPVSIVSPGLGLGTAPIPVKSVNGRVESFTAAAAPGGGTADYTFTVRPGTFLYESGTNPAVQVQMGLYGAIRVDASTPGQAYDSPGGTVPPFDGSVSAFDIERTLVLSEVDPALHAAIQNGTYGGPLYPSTINYQPKYFLINGEGYSVATPLNIYLGAGTAGQTLLLRFVNAGLDTHIPTMQGLYMNCVSEGGNLLPYAKDAFALPIEAGQTKDATIVLPNVSSIPLYDRRLDVTNAGTFPGGMLVFLNEADQPPPPPDTFGPLAYSVIATPNPAPAGTATVTLAATASDLTTGGSNIAAAEYWIGAVDPGVGLGTAMSAADLAFDSVTENLTSTLDTSAMTSGTYTINVRARDSANNWGAATSIILTVSNPALYISLNTTKTLSGINFTKSDIIKYDGVAFSRFFTGVQAGLPSTANVVDFEVISSTEIIMSFAANTVVPVAGTVTPMDIVKFTATSLGTTTAGSFSLYFKGSNVGLSTSSEKINAIGTLPGGDLLISTTGSASVTGGITGTKSSVLRFTPTTLGATTAGSWAEYFRGGDVGLSASSENIDGVSVGLDGKIYLGTTGNFSVAGVAGQGRDVFVFTPTTLGNPTTGTFSPTLLFDGSVVGLGTALVDGFSIF